MVWSAALQRNDSSRHMLDTRQRRESFNESTLAAVVVAIIAVYELSLLY